MIVECFTDGACRGNPGPGGWGVVMCYGDHRQTLYGAEAHTTNNRMELMAAIRALEMLTKPVSVDLYTDSIYVRDGITKWIHGWKKNGWKNASKKSVKNEDLWRRLEKAAGSHSIRWHWIKGHAGHLHNERADALAREAALAHQTNTM